MTLEIRESLQALLDSSDEDKLEYGNDGYCDFIVYLSAEEYNIDLIIRDITKLFVSADKKCGRSEYLYFNKVTNEKLATIDFYKMTNNGSDPKFQEDVFCFLATLPKGALEGALKYVAGLIACDDLITTNELKLYDRLICIYENAKRDED